MSTILYPRTPVMAAAGAAVQACADLCNEQGLLVGASRYKHVKFEPIIDPTGSLLLPDINAPMIIRAVDLLHGGILEAVQRRKTFGVHAAGNREEARSYALTLFQEAAIGLTDESSKGKRTSRAGAILSIAAGAEALELRSLEPEWVAAMYEVMASVSDKGSMDYVNISAAQKWENVANGYLRMYGSSPYPEDEVTRSLTEAASRGIVFATAAGDGNAVALRARASLLYLLWKNPDLKSDSVESQGHVLSALYYTLGTHELSPLPLRLTTREVEIANAAQRTCKLLRRTALRAPGVERGIREFLKAAKAEI